MSNDVHVGSTGFAGLLAVLFIGLKLGGVIDWSWWWVLAPLWAGFAIIFWVMLVTLVICIIALLATSISSVLKPNKRNIRQ